MLHKRTRAGKGKGKMTYKTKRLRSKPIQYEFRPKDEGKLMATYDPVQVQVLNPIALEKNTPLKGLITFHKKPLFLGSYFYFPNFIRYFLRHNQKVSISCFLIGGDIYFALPY